MSALGVCTSWFALPVTGLDRVSLIREPGSNPEPQSAGDPQGHGPAPCDAAHQGPGHIDLSALVLNPATGRKFFPILCKSLAQYR